MSACIPFIDLRPAYQGGVEGERLVAHQIDHACKTVGFFTVVGHDIPLPVFDAVYAASAAFFAKPLPYKQQCRPAAGFSLAPNDYTPYGYSALLEENAFAYTGKQGLPSDYVEKYSIGRLILDAHQALPFPEDDAGKVFRDALLDYFIACERFSARLAELMTIALDLPRDFFVTRIDRSNDSVRSLRYPPATSRMLNDQGMGEHTDGTLFTILTHSAAGIEVRSRDGAWLRPIPGSPDQLLVNIGDLMARWSNDAYVSTPHRVVLTEKARQSIAFFKLANDETVIDCFPKFCAVTPAKYKPVVYKDFSLQKMKALFDVAKAAEIEPS